MYVWITLVDGAGSGGSTPYFSNSAWIVFRDKYAHLLWIYDIITLLALDGANEPNMYMNIRKTLGHLPHYSESLLQKALSSL